MYFQPPTAISDGAAIVDLDRAAVRYCERLFFHSLKQALHLLHGSSRAFSELSLEQQLDLWLSPAGRRKWDSFASVRSVLIPRSPLETKHLPVRVVDMNGTQRLRLVKAVDDEGIVRTLGQALLDELQLPSMANNEHEEDYSSTNEGFDDSRIIVVAQGLQLPWTAPLFELWKRLSHADLVLYLLLIPAQKWPQK